MKQTLPIQLLIILTSTLLLGGCQRTKETLGLGRETPDEFTVLDRPPLTVPPAIGLRPPLDKTEETPYHSHNPKEEAQKALFKNKNPRLHTHRSKIEGMLLDQAHAEGAESGIRTIVNEESKVKNGYSKVVQDLLFWQKNKKKGDVINPVEENKKYNGKGLPGEKD